MEFHISRKSRDKYGFDLVLFSTKGNVIFANFHAARLFSQTINSKIDLATYPEKAIQAGQINALGLIDEIFHLVFHQYLEDAGTGILKELIAFLEDKLGKQELQEVLVHFDDLFPMVKDYREVKTVNQELIKQGDQTAISETLEEMLMLWITNQNPAIFPYSELFDDNELFKTSSYKQVIALLSGFFEEKPHFGPEDQDIVTMLRSPAMEIPYSLSGQLEYIRVKWGHLIGSYLYRLLGSLDLIKEEEKQYFTGDISSLPTSEPDLYGVGIETENFSPDSDWMPNVVMLAKNTYVWLAQLSKEYGKQIKFLSEIPDEALDMLAKWGFTGLWLIGLWERSQSSKRIKQLCGNPDAVASAYSLSKYQIANDLGGELAYKNVKDRASARGIRLASDMVPNHMGIDSDWVYDHPDWFIQLDHSPFPSYSFNGIDLSLNPDISINLEDHYYDRSDAAVVFKYYDHRRGQNRFIYHGNDGTSMPWNDTAQLNYLNPEVREAVIQTILEVARKFPIIRFDAAMTLTKKHYQRLWYPQPGSGGDIPTRAEYGMSKGDFDQEIQEEFWRQVVDRVSLEVPDTLLLAEAFWLMEGYFVRTLGMHRVYNSAFMNMLRNEENEKYRHLIKSTLEFDPQILKRYVNFMNNPDEKTAIEQFGKGDKYFGICTLLVTMPGLPMIGHGQIEGYAEKYGMEYYRPYWDEIPDGNLVKRHEYEIFPLLRKRYLFADVENFNLFNFMNDYGGVDENIFAYTNGKGSERSLVIINNKFSKTQGYVKLSTAKKSKLTSEFLQISIFDSLNLGTGFGNYVIFRDTRSNLQYIKSVDEIFKRGLYFTLEAYEYHVFLDFRLVDDDDTQQYSHLEKFLNGRGVPSIEEALRELRIAPILDPLRTLINSSSLSHLLNILKNHELDELTFSDYITRYSENYSLFLGAIDAHVNLNLDKTIVISKFLAEMISLKSLVYENQDIKKRTKGKYAIAQDFVKASLKEESILLSIILWSLLHNLGGFVNSTSNADLAVSLFDEWKLAPYLEKELVNLGLEYSKSLEIVRSLKCMISLQNWADDTIHKTPRSIIQYWLNDQTFRLAININRYNDVLWFNKELFQTMLKDLSTTAWLISAEASLSKRSSHVQDMIIANDVIQQVLKAGQKSGYQVQKMVESLK